MIKARHIWFYVNFINTYTRYNIKRHFSKVQIINNITCPTSSVLMIGNHSTWWDGFFAVYLNKKVFKKRIHVMMLEEQLGHRKFLNKAGAFSIKKGARSMVESIDYSKQILSDNNNLLLMFPQGEIQSSYTYPLKFEKGIMRLVKDKNLSYTMVFNAALIDYFSNMKPQLSLYLKNYDFTKLSDISELENDYNKFLKECMLSQKE